ncbi:ATP-binding cassette domain-containing protein [Candidatus Poribacteria bacterium]|nr:ATP-binding cassette domain-containing protein [Candidatus Poribacteria bacterium]
MTAIEIRGLTKYYGKFLAVDDVDFDVGRGEIFGFLGPNGAGKTTTVMMITTFLEPTAGSIRIHDYELPKESIEARTLMGIVPEESNVYTELTAEGNLRFTGKIYRMSRKDRNKRAKELLDIFGLTEKAHTKVQEFSKGMRRRLTVAMALMHNPKILFLDEPISGLDVQSARYIKKLVRDLNKSGVTIFLTTHQIEVANELCHRVAIIDRGRIATIGTPDELKGSIESVQIVEVSFKTPEDSKIPSLSGINGVNHELRSGSIFRLYTDNPTEVIPSVIDFSREHGLSLKSLNTLGSSLEDVFLKITGQEVGLVTGMYGDEKSPIRKRGKGRMGK